jgi:SAM-dependent methyltransferase
VLPSATQRRVWIHSDLWLACWGPGEAPIITPRPFYTEFAWAYDLLIDRPVQKECAVIATWLVERGVVPGSTILDAGCGTGRYALELSRRGYVVRGIDSSADLIDEATRAAARQSSHVSFEAGDILTLPHSNDDAVLCRGVLNDVIEDHARQSAFAAFARVLRDGGVLILDVREWEATAARKDREPLLRKRVETSRGKLTFTSVTETDPPTRRLLVKETHTLEAGGRERSWDYEFVMRCWTPVELQSLLRRNGFESIAYFGAYDPAVGEGATDRLVAVAVRRHGRGSRV